MFKGKLKKYLPSAEDVNNNRVLKVFGRYLTQPSLWHLNRHSVARGVAIGLVTGLIPGPVQILLAAALSIPFRANLPVAAFTTFYTNPFTFVPLYILAYKIGSFTLGVTAPMPPITELSGESWFQMARKLWDWIYGLGDTLLIGLAIQCSLFAVVGYTLVQLIWVWQVRRKWRRRHLGAK